MPFWASLVANVAYYQQKKVAIFGSIDNNFTEKIHPYDFISSFDRLESTKTS